VSAARKLDVYLRSDKVGVLKQAANTDLSFSYTQAYLSSKNPHTISVAMPLSTDVYGNSVAKPYFSGLLPDESARVRLARALGVSDTNAFGMLETIGGECAGALALHPFNSNIEQIDSHDEVLDETQLAAVLSELRGNPLLGGRHDVRLSLAGVQDKLAVKVKDTRIVLVRNGEPTTHILKPAIQGLEGTAQNEMFCMTLAKRIGLTVPDVQFAQVSDTAYVLVERFDRTHLADGTVQRLHQEDFCQALSVPPELKYEDEGGPGVEQSLALIQRSVNQPAADRLTFLRMQIFHFLVGNADAHAKNFALLHTVEPAAPSLAPLYDVVCTAAYPALSKKIAMRIGNRNIPDTIRIKQWRSLVPDTKASQLLLKNEIAVLAESIVPHAQQLLLDAETLGINHPILTTITQVIKSRAEQLMMEMS